RRMSAPQGMDALKAHAKQILTLARAGDAIVIGKLRGSLPRLAHLENAAISVEIKLADVQHAVARMHGAKSWAELKHTVENAEPVQVQAQRFLHALREHDGPKSAEILERHPEIAKYNAHTAAAACDVEALRSLLDIDPSLATKKIPPNDSEPLIYAAGTLLPSLNPELHSANTDCVRLLLQHGANPTAHIVYGDNHDQLFATYFACAANNVGAVQLLLEAGADPNDAECVPHAAERDHRECLELLLKFGANLSDRYPYWDNTPLYFLAGHRENSPLGAPSERGMQWLLEHGANPNVLSYVNEKNIAAPNRGEAPLHRIALNGRDVHVARMLVEYGADVNATRGDGRSAYALALRTGNTPVAEYLLSVGADTAGITPVDQLIAACVVADAPLARKILAMHPDLLSTFTDEDRQALHQAAGDGKVETVQLMIALGWSISAEGMWGGTPLHWASWHGRPEVARALIALGAPINVRDNMHGSSPIAWAAHGSVNSRSGHDDEYIAVIDQLLNAGATREAAYNSSNEAPEQLGSRAVAAYLKQREFSA
ncbi:MAG: ankyrin repeat domain-containing protein, partial [Gemmatimonadaceae bacterium]